MFVRIVYHSPEGTKGHLLGCRDKADMFDRLTAARIAVSQVERIAVREAGDKWEEKEIAYLKS